MASVSLELRCEEAIVIPRKYVEEIADKAVAMEAHEVLIKLKIASGASNLGVYPPNA